MTQHAILFDVDGTLVDSNGRHVLAWEEAFADFGHRFARETIHGQLGKGADMLIPTLLPDAPETLRSRIADRHGTIYKGRYLGEVKPFPRAHELLARAAGEGQKVVLASSASQEEVDHYLELLRAGDLVAAVTSAADVAHTKPAPDIFAAALGKASVPADAAIVVGDTPYDIEAARKCGLACVAVRSGGFSDAVLEAAGPAAIYDSAAALLEAYDDSPLADGGRFSARDAARIR